jgi:hypothetical protein
VVRCGCMVWGFEEEHLPSAEQIYLSFTMEYWTKNSDSTLHIMLE